MADWLTARAHVHEASLDGVGFLAVSFLPALVDVQSGLRAVVPTLCHLVAQASAAPAVFSSV